MLSKEQIERLQSPLPDWALKDNPMKKGMTVIHPMAIVDRLNGVFGFGQWNTHVEKLSSYDWIQKTTKGDRKVYTATSKMAFIIPAYNIHLEQFGGSTNDDEGDALKGSATDALTKIASYLGIGASVYKGSGNVAGKIPSVQPELGAGMSEEEFNHIKRHYEEENLSPSIEQYEKMSLEQRSVINKIKRDKRK